MAIPASALAALNIRSRGLNDLYGLGGKPAGRVNRSAAVPTAPAPRPVAPPQAGQKPPGVSPEEWARQQAQRYIDSLVSGIEAQRQSYLDEVQRNAELEGQRGAALAQALQAMNIPGAVQAIYGNAGNDIAGYAQGFAGDLRGVAQQETADQQRMLSGSGQEAAVRDAGVGMGDAFYGTQGYIPGKSMAEQGAAFASQAAMEPGFAQRIGQVKAGDVMAEGQAGLAPFAQQIAEARGQQFGMEQDLLKQRQQSLNDERDFSLAQQKAIMSAAEDDRTYWLKLQALYLSQKKTKLAAQAGQRAQAATKRYNNASMGLDYNGNVAPGYMRLPDGSIVKRSDYRASQKNKGLDENGNLLPGYKRNKSGVIVPRYKPPAPKAPPKPATLTPGQKADNIKTVLGKEEDITKKDLPQLAKQVGLDRYLGTAKPKPNEVARLQKSISRALWVRYSPYAATPAAKKALRNMIARLVKSYKPGGGGGLTEGLLD
jgi:hypothetical protein